MQNSENQQKTSPCENLFDGLSVSELESELIAFFASDNAQGLDITEQNKLLFPYGGTFDEEQNEACQEYYSRLLNSGSWYAQIATCFALAIISSMKTLMINTAKSLYRKVFDKEDYAKEEAEKNDLYFDAEHGIVYPRVMVYFLNTYEIREAQNEKEDAFLLRVIKALKSCGASVEDLQIFRYAPKRQINDGSIEDKLLLVLDDMKDGTLDEASRQWYYYAVERGITPAELERVENADDNGYMKFFNHLTTSLNTIRIALYNNQQSFDDLVYKLSSEAFVDKTTRDVLSETEGIDNYLAAFFATRENVIANLTDQSKPMFGVLNQQLNEWLNARRAILNNFENETGRAVLGDKKRGVYRSFSVNDLDYMLGDAKEAPFDFSALALIPSSAKKDTFIEKIISLLVRFHLHNDGVYQHHSTPADAKALYAKLKSERKPTAPDDIKTTDDFWASVRDYKEAERESARTAVKKTTAQSKPSTASKNTGSATTDDASLTKKIKYFFREIDLPYLIWGIVNLILLSGIFRLLGIVCVALPIIALYTKKQDKFEKPITMINTGCTALAILLFIVRLFISLLM